MARRSNAHRIDWHDRTAPLPDGDTLRYTLIEHTAAVPWIATFRTDRRGGLHPTEGRRLLTEIGREDAALGVMGDKPLRPLMH